jgi:hypothetical protein
VATTRAPRLRESRSLSRIGSNADFVEHDERAIRCAAGDVGEVRHVGRERREVLAEILLISNVSEYFVEEIDPRTLRCGHVHSRTGEERCECGCLQRDGLASRIRSREDQCSEFVSDLHVDGDHLVGRQKRVSKLW